MGLFSDLEDLLCISLQRSCLKCDTDLAKVGLGSKKTGKLAEGSAIYCALGRNSVGRSNTSY